ncbi:MAG TPA: DUF3618 domain-containing protein [Rubricoccaceae bacterium]|jgi:hypothetical protein
MAQEPDGLTASATGDGEAGTPTPAQIEREIERTRADMTETIDALGARFEPSYLKEQAQEAIVDTARSAGTSMIDTLKDNPLPAAIAGLSIAWLIANRSSGSTAGRSGNAQKGRYAAYGDYSGGYGASAGYRAPSGGSAGSGGGPSLVDKARGAASGLTETVSGTASDLADQARMTAHDVTSGAQDAAQRAESWLEGQIQSNPLGVGAVALVAGALVGMSLPTTDAEANLMGAPSSRLVEQAKDAASGHLDQAKDVAAKVASEVKDKAAEVVETAKTEVKGMAGAAQADGAGESSDENGPGGGPSGAPQAGAHVA